MENNVEIITVDASNVEKYGFFCYKSKKKTEGYRRKLAWLKERFAEGMKIQILYEGNRSVGFIEYIPGEFAWRAVNAQGYMIIHCLWVVGKGKGKGYGARLLNACVEDAKAANMHGIAMVTSEGNWLAGRRFLTKHGFESVDKAPPTFDLLVKKFDNAPSPTFPTDWDERLARFSSDVTIIRTDQCPYTDKAVEVITDAANTFGLETHVTEFTTAQQIQEQAPSAYGTFHVVHDGKLVAYHWIGEKEFRKYMETRNAKS